MRETFQHIPNLCRADGLSTMSTRSSGFAELDQALGGGWPVPALVELLGDQQGIGELQLLLPLIKSLSAATSTQPEAKPLLWINPPYRPHALAWLQQGLQPEQHWLLTDLNQVDALWSLEQALRSNACAMVLAWIQGLQMPRVRRLKLATLTGGCVAILFRPAREATQPSTAHIRLQLRVHEQGLQIDLLKVQGRRPSRVLLPLTAAEHRTCIIDKPA